MLHALVEGYLDAQLLKILLRQLGKGDRQVALRDAGGGSNFWKLAERYNEAGRHRLVLGLADLEQVQCASQKLATLKGGRSGGFKLRLAVRMIESWIIAERAAFAAFLGVPLSLVPLEPDLDPHPKRMVGMLAKRSSRRAIREGFASQYSHGVVGPEFTTMMAEFVDRKWDCARARKHSPSLERACIRWSDI